MLRVLAAVFALIAVGLMTVAIVGMVTGRPGDRAGLIVRAAAVLCFVTAVVLNIAAH
ncbi:MAG TPA: hypothetical protein VMA96_01775 [Solirubrobacteraceae bacterium]|nr:hypothetical protein [Solirubrobacteraceae bacterium]